SYRLGRHVRARWRRLLRRLLSQMPRSARRQRRDAVAFDRTVRRTQRHQSLDRKVHLPRRLHSGAVRGAARGRARRPAGHRHRNPAPPLCRAAEGLARTLPRPSRRRRTALRRALPAHVEFYLAASEMAFREQAMMVFQLQLTKRQGIVPMTRDYIAREEARLRALEGGRRPPVRLAGGWVPLLPKLTGCPNFVARRFRTWHSRNRDTRGCWSSAC